MAFQIRCLKCGPIAWVENIADVIDAHTDATGRPVCAQCGDTGTYGQHVTGRWEEESGQSWNEYIKGIIHIKRDAAAYTPYGFLIAD